MTTDQGYDRYVVQPGDCLDSIAHTHGFFWKTLWELPQNAGLRRLRDDPNVLFPGDTVYVPQARAKWARAATGATHGFRLRTVPSRLRVRFTEDGEPRSGDRYVADVDGIRSEGTLDGDGYLDLPISPNARLAHIWFDDADDPIELLLGHLDPPSTTTGIQSRLTNLGFACGDIDGIIGPVTGAALRAFQRSVGLEPTGAVNAATRAKLVELHGS